MSYTGDSRLERFRPSSPNKITGANAGGPPCLQNRALRVARTAHFCRYANICAEGKPMASKRRARSLIVYCAIATSSLFGRLPAQDFEYTITNGSITITNYLGPGRDVAIPANIDGLPVTTIGGQAFSQKNLTAITIPDTVTNIEDGFGMFGAFALCGALTNVVIGNNMVYIGDGTFRACTSLAEVSLPDSVTTVGQYAFVDCGALSEIKFGKSLTQVGAGMFGYPFAFCTNLTSVAIPASVTYWGANTFLGCSNLAYVTFENGVTNIGCSFQYCRSLTNVTLPASVASISSFVFADCENLAGVYCSGNAPATNPPPPGGGGIFYGSSNVTVYYLPGTSGWGPAYAGRPTMLWNPEMRTTDESFGVRQNHFGFNIAGTPDIPFVVEGSFDLTAPSWIPLQNCTLTNGLLYFSDLQWTNHPHCFYRIRSP